jgi:hypothetical protein
MNSFDHSPQCDENPNYEPTQSDWEEYHAYLDLIMESTWQDHIIEQLAIEDEQLVIENK